MKKLLSISILVLLTALVASGDITYSRELDERAILGDAAAMHELSVCYRMGTGVAKDLDKANYWLERAAQEGNPNALATLELLDNKTSLTEAKRRELAAVEQRERERLQAKSKGNSDPYQGTNRTFTVGGVSFTMVAVQGGTFTMGATSEQGSDAYDNEKPAHSVILSSYYIGETEVTQALWQAVMGSNPSEFKGFNHPVESVNWEACQEFLSRLNRITGEHFRLPTEAEWEFAARGGNLSKGYKYSGSDNLDDVAWYWTNSGNSRLTGDWDFDKINNNHCQTHTVASKRSNELGLYDMSGNVNELCCDWYEKDGYTSQFRTNHVGTNSGYHPVLRGGSWYDISRYCRVSRRGIWSHGMIFNFLGLRLAL